MKEKEFIFWMRGIVDSTQFMPDKSTWDLICDKLKEIDTEDNTTDCVKTLISEPLKYPYIKIEEPGKSNPDIIC